MSIWDTDKLLLFIGFVVPGFLSIKVYQLIFPGTERPASSMLVDAIAYSCINYSILFAPIYFFSKSEVSSLGYTALFYFCVLFLFPVIWPLIWKYIRTRDFFQKNAPHPTSKPWDWVFEQRESYWVKVILKDGTIIGGLYSNKSFSSSAPSPEQIYLEETWLLDEDGAFIRRKNRTKGVIILSSEISHIELRDLN
ncbi:hypothetical protein E5672_02030 [Alteromonas portus]|uniref:Uncharacterized protein n=1 Tax=Alteromonas portus TaxID=2565549 RepID=A0A4U0ZJ65_9ALTE|nr:DUF6338 family protein [Alteromonas portus]PHS44337.1 MAG: hypothetical protein COB03_18630 [Alteromonas sp.]TKB04893.1 hypothetical protein E5672_02030 [Alteromonas portus]